MQLIHIHAGLEMIDNSVTAQSLYFYYGRIRTLCVYKQMCEHVALEIIATILLLSCHSEFT